MSEVGVAELRKDLKGWLARVGAGDEVVITDRGTPIARLSGIKRPTALEELVARGRMSQPRGERPHARTAERVRPAGAVSDYVIEDRDARRR